MLLAPPDDLVALAIATPGLAQTGDFGRPKPSLLEGLIPKQFWKGPVTGYSWYPLTDLEEELRDRSYALIRPNEPRGNWNIYIAGFQIAHLLPPAMTVLRPHRIWPHAAVDARALGGVVLQPR